MGGNVMGLVGTQNELSLRRVFSIRLGYGNKILT
jgi:hypothetical protein